jgi:hypothetical protein
MYMRTREGLGDGWSRPCPPDVYSEEEIKDDQLIEKALKEELLCGTPKLDRSTIDCITDEVFYRRHPELVQKGKRIRLPHFKDANWKQKLLIYEWRDIRNCFVLPLLRLRVRFLRRRK